MYKTLMFKIFQQTISNAVSVEGIGLHTGKNPKLLFYLLKKIKALSLKEWISKKIILYSLITKMFRIHNFALV